MYFNLLTFKFEHQMYCAWADCRRTYLPFGPISTSRNTNSCEVKIKRGGGGVGERNHCTVCTVCFYSIFLLLWLEYWQPYLLNTSVICGCIYKVVQIWPGLFVCKQVIVCPGHIWTTLYITTPHTGSALYTFGLLVTSRHTCSTITTDPCFQKL
jgi:hypothetical protein